MNIVAASAAHLDQVAELFDLYRQFYDRPADADLARRYMSQQLENGSSVVFLALDDDGRALGFTQLYPTFCSVAAAPIYVLYDLFVHRDARRAGVGRALMEKAREHAEHTGARRIDLSTAIDNAPAQALYESLGYERDTKFYGYSLTIDVSD